MTLDEYKLKIATIEREYKLARNRAHNEYALSNAKFKVGDIIKDHRWIIKVDDIKVSIGFGDSIPEPVYYGYELKKDLTPKKSENREGIYGHNGVELVKAG